MSVRGSVQRVQDSVHGLMEFRGLEASLIEVLSAAELQRLRRIRQLGLVHLVFPAAEHSRLVHSLGAAHVALRFGRRLENATQDFLSADLQPDESTRRDLAIAALCHDLGHGPLSHVWEQEVVENFQVDAWVAKLGLPADHDWEGYKWHELTGQAILLDPETQVHQILQMQETDLPKRVAEMLRGEYHLSYIPQLLSGDIDVDRCDYVLRDATQTGVAYGRFDLDWLISTATVGAKGGDLVFGFDESKAPRVIEQFLIARRALYDTVYQHRTARAAEGMVGNLLRRISDLLREDDWVLANGDAYPIYRTALAGAPIGVPDLLALDDYSLWIFIMAVADRSTDPVAKDLATRIVARDLFKRVPVEPELVSRYLGRPSRASLERIVEERCGVADGSYYLIVDQTPFESFSQSEGDAAFLVGEPGDGPGRASFAKAHRALKPIDAPHALEPNLYVPTEAVYDVAATVSG